MLRAGRLLHQPDGAQDFLGSGDQFLDAYFFGPGVEGEAHELGDIENRKTRAPT